MLFCRLSRGSLHELIDQLITALDEEYITKSEYSNGKELIKRALGLLNGYINYLIKAKSDNNTFFTAMLNKLQTCLYFRRHAPFGKHTLFKVFQGIFIV